MFDYIKTRALLEANYRTVKWLAWACSKKPDSVSKMLRGKLNPSSATIRLMGMALGVPDSELLIEDPRQQMKLASYQQLLSKKRSKKREQERP